MSRYLKDWGLRNDTEVIVDWVGFENVASRVAADAAAEQGHDITDFTYTPGIYEDQVIDHRELYQECESRYGKAVDLAIGESYNPITRKYHGFVTEWGPTCTIYRNDLWNNAELFPDTWDTIRLGGRRIKFLHDHPVGIGLNPRDITSEITLWGLLYSFGATVQDSHAKPVLKSQQTAQTLDALNFVKALYQEAMVDEVLNWDSGVYNNRFMLSGQGSLTLNAISITRSSENKVFPIAPEQLSLAPAPQGPVNRLSITSVLRMAGIWQFASNIEAAQQFLIDYIGHSRQALLASQFFLLPVFPQAVPDLKALLANDAAANPLDKYQVLADAGDWNVNLGYPGYSNAAMGEMFETRLISKMFAAVASDKMTPQEALDQADQEVRKIYDKWRALGKV